MILALGAGRADASSVIVVDSVADDADANAADGICATAAGECTLRAAIETANALPGSDTINFDIPGAGTHTIAVGSDLPNIYDTTGWLEIDGYTQGDATPNTAATGSNAVIRVQLQGTSSYGLRITSSENTIKGLSISGFDYNIAIHYEQSDGNTIVGNFIGPDAAGNEVAGSRYGVWIWLGPDRNVIGTPNLADRNVISGNVAKGLQIEQGNTSRNVIQNNVIGLNPSLTAKMSQAYGMDIQWGTWNNLIGGENPGEGNLFGGMRIGIDLSHSSAGSLVLGNYFGTLGDGNSASDVSALDYGILLKDDSKNNFIADNVIANTTLWGIWSRHNYNGPSTIVGNRFGVGIAGAPLPSAGKAIQVNGHDDLIQDNIIGNHGNGGVAVVDITYVDAHTNHPPEQTLGNRLIQNSFYSNGSRGWEQIGGALAHVSVGVDRSMWGVNSAGNVYRRTADGPWQFVSGGMAQVDAFDYDTAVGVNTSDAIFRFTGGSWQQIGGALSHVSIGVDGSMWGVNSNNNVYRRTADAQSWQQMPGLMAQVDALDYDNAVAVNTSEAIYRFTGGAWQQIGGSLKHISVGVDGSMWGVNRNDNVYRRTADATAWEGLEGEMAQIDAYDYETAVTVDASDRIFRSTVGVGLHIDIEPLGTENVDDPGDADDGTHRLLNRPVFTGAGAGQVYGTACAGCEVQIYLNGGVASDGSVNLGATGGAAGWAGTVVADGGGKFSLADNRMTVGRRVWGLVIDAEGNTSEWQKDPLVIPAEGFGIEGNPGSSLARKARPATPTLPDAHVRIKPGPFACSVSGNTLSWSDAGADAYYIFATTDGTATYLGSRTGTSTTVGAADSFRVTHWRFNRAVSGTCDGPPAAPSFDCSVSNGVLSWTDAGASAYYVFSTTGGVDRYLGGHSGTTLAVSPADSFRVTHWAAGSPTRANCEGGPAPSFDCSVSNGVLSWTDAGASAYYVFSTIGGVDRYLGGHSGTTLAVTPANSFRVTHWLGGGPTRATCPG